LTKIQRRTLTFSL